MEWVETTGKTVEEALEAALEQLGVDVADAEYEVLEEAKTGLFGRLRTEARIRARVQPTTPRAKEERRGRGRKGTTGSAARAPKASGDVQPAAAGAEGPDDEAPPPSRAPRRNPTKAAPPSTTTPSKATRAKDVPVTDTDTPEVPLAEQGALAAGFVQGVLERFGAPDAAVSVHEVDSETVEVRVEGGDLGLLIGPKGAALQSLQELTRTVVQRQTGARSGRILVDVSGYRAKRKEALERFGRKITDDVLASATRVVLEPMNPSDRKVIHDTINGIDGVSTSSEGEEPWRRVVVSPA